MIRWQRLLHILVVGVNVHQLGLLAPPPPRFIPGFDVCVDPIFAGPFETLVCGEGPRDPGVKPPERVQV